METHWARSEEWLDSHPTHSELTAQVLNHMEAPYCYPGSKDELSTYYVPGSILSAEAMTKNNTDGVSSPGGDISPGSALSCPNSYPLSHWAPTAATWFEMP